jgi:hypothetical protein
MATVTIFKRATGKAHLTSVAEADQAISGGMVLTASGTAGLYNDSVTTAVTIGGSATTTGNLFTGAAMTTLNIGTGMGAGDSINIGTTGATTTIPGDLVVEGTTTSVDSEVVNIADNHLYLNKDYTTAVAQTGGLVVNYLPTATATTSTTGGFASATTVNTVGAATFTAGDFVQVSGAATAANDGVYEVLTHAANVLTIDSTPVEDWVQTAFTTDTGDTTAALTNVTISVLRAGTDGVWETGSGTSQPISFTDLASGGNTLQQAYVAGNTISMSDAEGNFDVSVGSGTPAISLDAAGASNFTVASNSLTLSTTTSGSLILTGAALVDINAGANLDIDVTGTYDMLATGAFSIDGTGASNVTATSGNLTLSTATSGDVVVTGAANVDIDSAATGSVLIDGGDAGVSIDAVGSSPDSNFSIQNTAAATSTTLTITADNVGATSGDATISVNATSTNGSGVIDVNADNTITADVLASGTISIQSSAAAATLNLGTGAAAQTVTLGSSNTTSTTTINSGTGGLDANSTGTVTIDGVGASNLTTDSGNLTLSTTTSGDVIVTAAANVDINSAATGSVLIDGGDAGVSIDAVGSSPDSNFSIQNTAASTSTTLTITADNVGATAGDATLQLNATSTNGSGLLDLNADDAITVDSAAAGISLDGVTASNFTVTGAADLTLSSTAGSVVVSGGEAVADAVQVTASNAAGGIDINAGATSGVVTIDGGGACTITTAGINLAGGSSEIDLTTTGAVDINSAAGTWDSTSTLAFEAATSAVLNVTTGALTLSTTTSGDVTISTTTAGDILLSGAAEIDLTAVTLVDVNAADFQVDATAAISLDSATASNFTVSGATADLTLGARAGTITLNETGQTTLTNFTATSIIGALNELKNTAGGDRLTEFYITTARTVGEAVYIDADSSAASLTDANALATTEPFIGVVLTVGGAGTGQVVTAGTANCLFENGSATPAAGDPIYLSEVAGRVTGTAPNGSVVIYQIGILKDDAGLTATTIGTNELADVNIRPFQPIDEI